MGGGLLGQHPSLLPGLVPAQRPRDARQAAPGRATTSGRARGERRSAGRAQPREPRGQAQLLEVGPQTGPLWRTQEADHGPRGKQHAHHR